MIDQYPPANGVLTSLIWRKTAAGGETSLSGYDNASQALSYTPGQEQVYLNGILLVRGSDYTATNGTSITGLAALAADDFVQINCYNNFSVATLPTSGLTGTISNAQLQNSSITINGSAVSLGGSVSLPGDIESVTASSPLTGGGSSGAVTIGIQSASTSQSGAVQLTDSTSSTSTTTAATPNAVKSAYDLANAAIPKSLTTTTGDIIYASAANTPARLPIGTTDQVLKVSGGIPTWATPAAGGSGLTLITSQSFTNSTSVQINNCFSSTYRNYRVMLSVTAISAQSTNIYFRYSSGGSPNSGSIYSFTSLDGGPTSSPTASAGRNLTSTQFECGYYDPGYSPNNLMPYYTTMDIFAPNVGLYQKGMLGFSCSTYATNPINTYIKFWSGWCLSNASFDGFQIRPQGSDGISGIVRVYGYQD